MKELIKKKIWREVEGYEGLYEVSNFGRFTNEIKAAEAYQSNLKGITI